MEGDERARPSVLRVLAALALVPCALLLPIIASGRLFLPLSPLSLEPLASEHPDAARVAARDTNFPQSDRLFPYLTDQIAMRDEVLRGHLPLWEPAIGLGIPLFAGSLAGMGYPPNWLALVLPPARVAGPLALLSLFLAGLGAWVFLRRLGLGAPAALAGALAFQLGGWGIGNLYYPMKVDAALFLPWCLWAIEGLARRRRWSGLALTLAVAATFSTGFVTISLFVLCAAALWALARSSPLGPRVVRSDAADAAPDAAPTRTLARCALFVALGIAAASYQLLPMLEASRQSDRTTATTASLAADTLPARAIVGTLVPDLVGRPTDTVFAGELPIAWWLTPAETPERAAQANPLEWNTYAGTFVVLLALTALASTPRRAALPALLLACAWGFAVGIPPFRWLFALPGFNVGAPLRVLGTAWFLWPWLAALGVQALLDRAPRALGAFLVLGAATAAVAFLFWTGLEPERWARGVESTLLGRFRPPGGLEELHATLPRDRIVAAGERLVESSGVVLGSALAALCSGLALLLLGRPRRAFEGFAKGPALFAAAALVLLAASAPAGARGLGAAAGALPGPLAAVAVATGIALLWRRGSADMQLALLLLAGIAGEGLIAARGHVSGRPGDELFPPSATIDAIGSAAGDGRVIRYDASPSGVSDLEVLARPNMLQAYGISDLTGWIPFTPRRLRELFGALDPRSLFRSQVARLPDPALVDHPVLDLVRAQAVVARAALDAAALAPVLERPGFHVYRRAGAFAPARVVPTALPTGSDEEVLRRLVAREIDLAQSTLLAPEDGAGAGTVLSAAWQPGRIDVERPSRSRLRVRVEASGGGWLVVHEQSYPGWRASVDGRPVPLLRADHAFRAVAVPAGDSVTEMWYSPRSVKLGAWLSLLAVVAAFLVARR